MWTVICTVQSKDVMDKLCHALKETNILVKTVCSSKENRFDILVPSTEVEQAHEILIDYVF